MSKGIFTKKSSLTKGVTRGDILYIVLKYFSLVVNNPLQCSKNELKLV